MSIDSLQSSINDALVSDQRKMQINDAKLRAVGQRVEYDEFCKMVAGAHLKPVKPCSRESAEISKPFEYFVMPKYEPAAASVAPNPNAAAAESFTAPKDVNEFTRIWRRKCKSTESKLVYLRTMAPEEFPLLFRAEMDPVVMDGVAAALRADVGKSDAPAGAADEWVGNMLLNLSRINRFDLTLQLADTSTADALKEIFDALASRAPAAADGTNDSGPLDQAALTSLRQTYRLK